MKLPVLLLLALPALSSADSCVCENTEPVPVLDPSLADRVPEITALPSVAAIGNISSSFTSFMFNQNHLEWQTFGSSPPDGSISIYNGYVGRIDYVCKYGCEAGFYNPDMGPYCHYPYAGKEYRGSPFEILVNKDNFEFMEWKDGSYGSLPQNSVKTCANTDKYVGKNKFGLGKVHVRNEAFFLPWQGSEYWYKYYQVLTFNKEISSEDISDVKYKTDGVKIIEHPPESMRKSATTNRACQPVTETATLSKTNQVEQRWDTSPSPTLGVKSSITAGIPEISSASIEFSVETTLQFTKGTTYIESTTHTVSVQHEVPPNHSCGASTVAYKHSADIPPTARPSRTHSNGETTWTSISGTYKSVQTGEVRAAVDRREPLPDARPCE